MKSFIYPLLCCGLLFSMADMQPAKAQDIAVEIQSQSNIEIMKQTALYHQHGKPAREYTIQQINREDLTVDLADEKGNVVVSHCPVAAKPESGFATLDLDLTALEKEVNSAKTKANKKAKEATEAAGLAEKAFGKPEHEDLQKKAEELTKQADEATAESESLVAELESYTALIKV